MTEIELNAYKKFMYNPANIYNCTECPENEGRTEECLPCGQQNCWVQCHCDSANEN
jgi:hypothetical protein